MRCVCDGCVRHWQRHRALSSSVCSIKSWILQPADCVARSLCKNIKDGGTTASPQGHGGPNKQAARTSCSEKIKKVCPRVLACVNARQASPILVACGGSGLSNKERGRRGGEMSERLTDFTLKQRPERFVAAAGSWLSNRRQSAGVQAALRPNDFNV